MVKMLNVAQQIIVNDTKCHHRPMLLVIRRHQTCLVKDTLNLKQIPEILNVE